MSLDALALAALVLAALPAALTLLNLPLFRAPRRPPASAGLPPVCVLIPARDEEARIEESVRAALASEGVDVEVVVMDDHSADRTREIVLALAEDEPRLRLERAPELPAGWCGKPAACQALADRTSAPVLLFIDADVRLERDGVARAVGRLLDSGAALSSGFPRQETKTLAERLLIPLMHVLLLGYLPLPGLLLTRHPMFAAGCGQLMVARREAYEEAGGHAAVRTTFHDGLALPRAFRRAGLATDVFDATHVARCRMYDGAREVVLGLAKNAREGLAGPVAIWIWSALLLGGHVLPAALAVAGVLAAPGAGWTRLALAGAALTLGTRVVLALRFRQSLLGALLHPVGVLLLVAVQWFARLRRGGTLAWKGRVQVGA